MVQPRFETFSLIEGGDFIWYYNIEAIVCLVGCITMTSIMQLDGAIIYLPSRYITMA